MRGRPTVRTARLTPSERKAIKLECWGQLLEWYRRHKLGKVMSSPQFYRAVRGEAVLPEYINRIREAIS